MIFSDIKIYFYNWSALSRPISNNRRLNKRLVIQGAQICAIV